MCFYFTAFHCSQLTQNHSWMPISSVSYNNISIISNIFKLQIPVENEIQLTC